MGYHQRPGGSWNGDVLYADWEEVEEADTPSDMYVRRIAWKEVEIIKQDEKFSFPLAQGELQQPGQKEKTRRLPKRKKDKVDADDPPKYEGERIEEPIQCLDTWSITSDMLIRNHVTPRTSLYNPKEEDTPISIKYIDVTRITETDLDSQVEARAHDLWYRQDDGEAGGHSTQEL